MFQMPRTPFDKLPASGVERGICTSNSPSTSKASAIKPLGLFAFDSCIITNTAGQAQLMGKPADTPDAVIADAVKQSIATSTTTTEVQANSGAIANNFDKDAVQSEIDLQVKVTQQFDTTRQQATSMVNTKIDSLKKELETAKTPEEAKAIQDKIDNWQLVGLGINSIAAGLSAPTNSGLGIVASAATPTLQFEIGQYFKDNKVKNEQEKELAGLLGLDTNNVSNRAEEGSPAHLLAQTLLAAASAYAGGNNGLMAGLTTGAGEAFTPTLSNWLYGKPPQELSADQKQTLSNIVGLGAAGFTASMGGSGANITNSANLAQIGVEENRSGLSKREGDLQASDYCRTHPNGAGCKSNQVSQAYQTTVNGMMNLCAKDHSVCSTQIEVAKGMLDKTTNSAARGQILNYIQAMQGIWDGSPTAQAEYAMKEQQRIDDLNKHNAQVLIDTGFNKQNYSVVYPDGNPSAIHVGIDGKPLIADSFVAGGCSAYAQNCGSAIERALYDDPRSQAVVTDWTLAQHETGLGELSNGLNWMQIAAPVTKPVAGTIQVAVDGVKYEVMYERNKEWVKEIVKEQVAEELSRKSVEIVLIKRGMNQKLAEATAKVLVEKISDELAGD